ncbi:TPA: sulfurtransferase TusA family protein [Candidatus Bathyarchaeota archaeon]|nr:sulfurtransferase TusA family protein [Candidatus Bathyarchaeota archaeon]
MVMTLDLSGEVCPVPLVKSRRAMDKMESGDILEIIVTREDSRVNIVMAAKELGMEIRKIGRDKAGKWHIIIRKK